MIKKANEAGKPIITATQMMESMIKNPRPTRAEASDIANAVLDGSDCVMLSGETANGDYPLNAVETMAKICVEAELVFNHRLYFQDLVNRHRNVDPIESLARAAVKISSEFNIKAIFCVTETGKIARYLAKYRSNVLILAIR